MGWGHQQCVVGVAVCVDGREERGVECNATCWGTEEAGEDLMKDGGGPREGGAEIKMAA